MDRRTGRELGYSGSKWVGKDNPFELCDRVCHTVVWNDPGSWKRIRPLGLARTSETSRFGELQHSSLDRGSSDSAGGGCERAQRGTQSMAQTGWRVASGSTPEFGQSGRHRTHGQTVGLFVAGRAAAGLDRPGNDVEIQNSYPR